MPTIIGTIGVALMFMANQLIWITKEYPVQVTPTLAIVQLILYKTPGWLQMTLPVGTALGASLAVARLARESEVTAMRSAGVSILRIVIPVTLFGLFIAGANYFLAERIMPQAEKRFDELRVELGAAAAAPVLQENVVQRLQNYLAVIGSVQRRDDGTMELRDIMLVEYPVNGVQTIITAATGRYSDGLWRFSEPIFREFEGAKVVTGEARKELVVDEKMVIDPVAAGQRAQMMTRDQLSRAIRDGREAKQDTRNLEIEFHTRIAVPASCVVFALVAPLFAVMFARSGGFMGVLLSIFLVFAYYNAFVISTEVLGRNGLVPPIVAAWLPNVIFAALGLVAVRRLE